MSARATMNDVIRSHNLIHVATVDAEGTPHVRGVDYAAGEKENILYFITHGASRKIEHIRANPTVGFAIDRDLTSWEELAGAKFIKGTAIATIIDDPQEMQLAVGLIMAKFPHLSSLPGDPAAFAGVRLTLQKVLVTDNAIHFGHTEEIDCSQ